jgi:carbon monoxide dehydrogenase subunit G
MDAENKFRFDDTNETVKERLDKFEKKLHQSMTG